MAKTIPADVIYYTAESIATPAEAQNLVIENKIESKEEQITRIAEHWKIASTTLYNAAFSESSLGEKRVGDGGKSCGIVHFHQDYYPEEFARCEDDEYILNRAAEMISKGEEWKFVVCNCFAYAEVLTPYKLPRNNEIIPNLESPRIGSIAILRYKNDKHLAVITKITEQGIWVKEANFEPCKLGSRLIEWNDSHLKGFYMPSQGG